MSTSSNASIASRAARLARIGAGVALLLLAAAPAHAGTSAPQPAARRCDASAVLRAERDLAYAKQVDAWGSHQQATLALTLDPAETDRLLLVRARAAHLERTASVALHRALAACPH
jgi:hypothetical protein